MATAKITSHGIAAAMLLSPLAHAELILLEQFDYEGTNTPLNGFEGGVGFEGAWEVVGWSRPYDIGRTAYATGDSSLIVNDRGGLDFEGHPSAGSALGRFGTAGQQEAHRVLTDEAKAALTADESTIWFSVLASAPNGNKFGTIIFGTDPMIAMRGSSENGNLSSATGQAFGMGFRIDNGGLFGGGSGSPNAVAFVDSASATVVEGSNVPPFVDGSSHHDVALVVGKINWKPDGTSDELFIFNVTEGLGEPAEGDAIAALTADFDQSNFTQLSLQDTGSTIFDEIRFGTTFPDVAPGAGPSTPLAITDIGFSTATKELTLTWSSKPGTTYAIQYTTDMVDWAQDIDDGVLGDDGESTTRIFDLSGLVDGSTQVFFRVEEVAP